MADPTFQANWPGYREYMMSGDLFPVLQEHADVIEARAKALAAPHYRTGAYEHSIHTERDLARDRVRVRVVADDDVAAILEARYHIMGRAVG